MLQRRYSVQMHTLLGDKHGIITALIADRSLSGQLDILGHRNPFAGTIDSCGNCTITGIFITLLRTVHYTATGTLTPAAISLQIRGERNLFDLTGTACTESEVTSR